MKGCSTANNTIIVTNPCVLIPNLDIRHRIFHCKSIGITIHLFEITNCRNHWASTTTATRDDYNINIHRMLSFSIIQEGIMQQQHHLPLAYKPIQIIRSATQYQPAYQPPNPLLCQPIAPELDIASVIIPASVSASKSADMSTSKSAVMLTSKSSFSYHGYFLLRNRISHRISHNISHYTSQRINL